MIQNVKIIETLPGPESSNKTLVDLDEMEEPEVEAAEMAIAELCTGSSCDSVPATNLLQIRVGIFTIYIYN